MLKKIFSIEFKVGLTVTIATLILIFGIIWGKEFRLRTNKYQMHIVFDQVGGMVPGDPVTVNGVREGKVIAIGWHDRQVLCTVEINNHVHLYEDATFVVVSAEILAGMKIEIFPGISSKHINLSQQPFMGKYGGRIVDVGLVIGELAEDISALSFRLDTTVILVNAMLKAGNLQNDLSQSLNNFKQMTTELKAFPEEMKKTLSNLDGTIGNVNSLVSANSHQIGTLLHNLNSVSTRLDTITVSLQTTMTKIANNEGTLGKMVNDQALYDKLNRTLQSVDSLAKAIKNEGLKLDLF